MAEEYTDFSEVYTAFFSKITDDMFLQLTLDDTKKILQELLISAIPKFEFPRVDLSYQKTITKDRRGNINVTYERFNSKLNDQEINIIATYMVVEWLGQQLASVENVRMKYSGSD